MVLVVRFYSVVRNDFEIFWTFANFETFTDYVVALDFDSHQNKSKPAFKRKISSEQVSSRSL